MTISLKNRVLVAFSGGVDSLAAATLLQEKGYQVATAFMKLNADSDAERARELAKEASLPFYLFDFQKEFEAEIIKPFIDAYKRGETPNPCIDCNQKIKLELFWREAQKLGFDLIATGHYARLIDGNIYRGVDKNKDQSYFLWRLKETERLILPLGDYYKEEIKKIIKVDSKESMEICFIKDLREFLLEKVGQKEGEIVNQKGVVVGRHSGLWFYTIGQRKGIGLSGGPYFVTGKDFSKNILMVGLEPPRVKTLYLRDLNISSPLPLKAEIQLRYNGEIIPALIEPDGKVVFDDWQETTAIGQSGVIYSGDRLIGGGIVTYPF